MEMGDRSSPDTREFTFRSGRAEPLRACLEKVNELPAFEPHSFGFPSIEKPASA